MGSKHISSPIKYGNKRDGRAHEHPLCLTIPVWDASPPRIVDLQKDCPARRWTLVAAARKKAGAAGIMPPQWRAWWSVLVQQSGSRLNVEPMRAGACARPDRCIGTDLDGKCVCYD